MQRIINTVTARLRTSGGEPYWSRWDLVETEAGEEWQPADVPAPIREYVSASQSSSWSRTC